MKYLNFLRKLILIVLLFGIKNIAFAQSELKLGENSGTKNNSAILEIESTKKGLLIPRMTTVQMNAIVTPVTGLMIYNTDLNCIHYYFAGWKSQCDPGNLGAWALLGNAGTNVATNFLGTTDNVGLVTRTNNIERMRITAAGNVGIGISLPTYQLEVQGINPLRLNGLQSGALTDSLLTSNGGVVRRISVSQLTGATTNTLGLTGNTLTSTVNGIAATSNAVSSVANTSTANTLLTTINGVAGTGVNIINTNTTSLSGTSLVTNINGVASTGLDIAPAIGLTAWRLLGNAGTTEATNFLGTTDNIGLSFRTNNILRASLSSGGNFGIGIATPTYKLDVQGTNPLRLNGLVNGAATDSVLTSANGVVRRLSAAALTQSNAWSLLGNTGTNTATNFLGTTDNVGLILRTNNAIRQTITAGGKVGIGILAPTSAFHVTGTQSVIAEQPARFDNTITGSGATVNGLWDWSGHFTNTTVSPTTTSGNWYTGSYNLLRSSSNNFNASTILVATTSDAKYDGTGNLGALSGINPYAHNTSTGTITSAIGGNDAVGNTAGGTITEAIGTRGWVFNTSTGTIASSIGIMARVQNTGAGTTTNGYGVKIEDIQATNDFGIYQEGADDANYFAGNTGIGITSPAYKLDVRGTNPLRLNGLVAGAITDSILTSNAGVVRRISVSQLTGATTNTLGLTGNTLTSTVNGIAATSNAVSSVANTSTANTLLTTINGVTGTGVNIINTNTTSLSGTSLTTTINGVASTALDLSPAINTTAWRLLGNSGTVASTNFIGTTDNVALVTRTNNVERMRVTETGNVGVATATPTSTMQVAGSFATAIRSVSATAAATITTADCTILVDCTTAAITMTLPAATTCSGRTYTIKKLDAANALSFNLPLILDLSQSLSSTTMATTFTIQSDGTSWYIVNRF